MAFVLKCDLYMIHVIRVTSLNVFCHGKNYNSYLLIDRFLAIASTISNEILMYYMFIGLGKCYMFQDGCCIKLSC